MVNRLLIVLGARTVLCLEAGSGLRPRARETSLLLGTGVRTITPPLGVALVGYLVTEAIRREGGHEANSAVLLGIEKPFLTAAREALSRALATEK